MRIDFSGLKLWWKRRHCRHWFGKPFWVGNSDVRPFQVQLCENCGIHNYKYQD